MHNIPFVLQAKLVKEVFHRFGKNLVYWNFFPDVLNSNVGSLFQELSHRALRPFLCGVMESCIVEIIAFVDDLFDFVFFTLIVILLIVNVLECNPSFWHFSHFYQLLIHY